MQKPPAISREGIEKVEEAILMLSEDIPEDASA